MSHNHPLLFSSAPSLTQHHRRIFVAGIGFFSLCFLMTSLGGQLSAKRPGEPPFTARAEGRLAFALTLTPPLFLRAGNEHAGVPPGSPRCARDCHPRGSRTAARFAHQECTRGSSRLKMLLFLFSTLRSVARRLRFLPASNGSYYAHFQIFVVRACTQSRASSS